jgi:hypothetical protein
MLDSRFLLSALSSVQNSLQDVLWKSLCFRDELSAPPIGATEAYDPFDDCLVKSSE